MFQRLCKQNFYPFSEIKRFPVPVEKKPWFTEFPEYAPVAYTAPEVIGKVWADPMIGEASFKPKWNSMDGEIYRKSFMGDYVVNEEDYPLNPTGRTGISGRGLLGRWGPNHAADPIVTRWKRNSSAHVEVNQVTDKPVLQFVAIQRRDTAEWAIPGGMVDHGEKVSTTLKREFMEEALNSLEKDHNDRKIVEDSLRSFFENGEEVYKGYVEDHRNTDNAWIETVAYNFHDEDGKHVGKLALQAGDDASGVRWTDIHRKLELYASHINLIKLVVERLNAHW